MPSVVDILKARLGGEGVEPAPAADGMPTIYLTREALVETCLVLRDDPELGFSVLIDAIPVDLFPREPRFEIGYLLPESGRRSARCPIAGEGARAAAGCPCADAVAGVDVGELGRA